MLEYGQFSSVLLTSPKLSVVALIPVTVVRDSNHHKRRLSSLSCMCPETIAFLLVERAEPDNPSEAVGDLGRRSHQNNPRREESSRRRVLSTSSASHSCQALDELFVLRDVSILPGTPCPAFLGYQKTSPANTRTPDVAKRSLPILEDTQMDTALTI